MLLSMKINRCLIGFRIIPPYIKPPLDPDISVGRKRADK